MSSNIREEKTWFCTRHLSSSGFQVVFSIGKQVCSQGAAKVSHKIVTFFSPTKPWFKYTITRLLWCENYVTKAPPLYTWQKRQIHADYVSIFFLHHVGIECFTLDICSLLISNCHYCLTSLQFNKPEKWKDELWSGKTFRYASNFASVTDNYCNIFLKIRDFWVTNH